MGSGLGPAGDLGSQSVWSITKGGARPRVLVVDDDVAVADVVREVLEEAGYAVVTATHGASALEILTTYEPALILVDLRMPIMDGWSFIGDYRRRGGPARIIAFTALGDAATQAAVPGADALVAKPFELDELLTTIASVVDSGVVDAQRITPAIDEAR